MAAGGGGDGDAAQHPRDLLDARRALQRRDLRAGRLAVGELAHPQVTVTERRDLRQVGDAQHLCRATERGELAPDDLRDRAADAGVDLIEDHAGAAGFGARSEGDLHREREPRELAARGDLRERSRRLARIGRDQELDVLEAAGRAVGGCGRVQRHLEAAARHAQGLHPRADVAAERLGGLGADRGEASGGLMPGPAGRAHGLAVCLQRLLDALEAVELGLQLGGLGGQLGRRHAVPSGGGFDGGEPLFHLFLARRVGFETVQVARELARGVGEADHRGIEPRQQRFETRVERGGLAQRRVGACGERMRAARVGLVEELRCAACGLREPPAVGEPRAFGDERRQFVGPQRERGEFVHLMAQQVEARVTVAGLGLERGEGGGTRRALAVQRDDLRREGLRACVGVEQLPLRGGAQQRLELVLAVDLGEEAADLAQHLHRHLLAVEVRARLALARDHAAHHELVVGIDALLLEQAAQRGIGAAQVEGGGDLGAFRAVADGLGAGARTDRELQRIDQDGLAGAGLAGEHGEAALELDLDGVDDGEVADLQVGEHGAASGRGVERAPAPVELAAQQTVVVVARRVQQRDACRGGADGQAVARREAAERAAVAGHLGEGVGTVDEPHLDVGAARDDDRAVGEGVWTDGRDHEHIETRLHDRAAAGERVGRRAGGGRDHEAVAAVGVDEAAADPGLEVDEMTALALLQDHVVERESAGAAARGRADLGGEQGTFVAGAVAGQRRIDARQHVLGHDIGEEPQPPAVHAEQRHTAAGDEPRRLRHEAGRIEERTVAADGDHEVRRVRERGFGDVARGDVAQARRFLLGRHDLDAAPGEMARQHDRAVGGADIGEAGDEGAAADGGHGVPTVRASFYHGGAGRLHLRFPPLDAVLHVSVASRPWARAWTTA